MKINAAPGHMFLAICALAVGSYVLAQGETPRSEGAAGTVYTLTARDVTKGTAKGDVKLSLQAGRLRAEITEEDTAENMTLIFTDEALLLIDVTRKEYITLDKAALQSIKDATDRVAEQMEQRLASMNDAQKAAARREMEEQAPWLAQEKKVPVLFRDTGKDEKVGEYTCRIWEGTAEGVIRFQHCVVPLDRVPGSRALIAKMKAIQMQFEVLTRMGEGQGPMGEAWEGIDVINGIPVRTREYKNGKLDSEETLTDVRVGPLDDSTFAPPAGYKRMEMPAR